MDRLRASAMIEDMMYPVVRAITVQINDDVFVRVTISITSHLAGHIELDIHDLSKPIGFQRSSVEKAVTHDTNLKQEIQHAVMWELDRIREDYERRV
jgi:hypothetical protein